jgi:hypothetical protein
MDIYKLDSTLHLLEIAVCRFCIAKTNNSAKFCVFHLLVKACANILNLEMQGNSCELAMKYRDAKVNMNDTGNKSKENFNLGTKVEVRSDEEGFRGSWYTAIILELIGNDKFFVEYQTLKTEDETELLKEEADVSDIRPCPPDIEHLYRFAVLEKVDVWYNEGWWVGHVSKVLDDLRYRVYFETTNEVMEFEHSDLRPHQEWIDGNWVAASRV